MSPKPEERRPDSHVQGSGFTDDPAGEWVSVPAPSDVHDDDSLISTSETVYRLSSAPAHFGLNLTIREDGVHVYMQTDYKVWSVGPDSYSIRLWDVMGWKMPNLARSPVPPHDRDWRLDFPEDALRLLAIFSRGKDRYRCEKCGAHVFLSADYTTYLRDGRLQLHCGGCQQGRINPGAHFPVAAPRPDSMHYASRPQWPNGHDWAPDETTPKVYPVSEAIALALKGNPEVPSGLYGGFGVFSDEFRPMEPSGMPPCTCEDDEIHPDDSSWPF